MILRRFVHSISVLLFLFAFIPLIQCVGNSGNNYTNSNNNSDKVEEKAENLEYVDLGLSVYWAKCNVGAENPEEYGDYYAWGETDTHYELGYSDSAEIKWKLKYKNGYDFKSYVFIKNYKSEYGNHEYQFYGPRNVKREDWDWNHLYSELYDFHDVAYKKRGEGWRLPSIAEFQELRENCIIEFVLYNGIKGFKITSTVPGFRDSSIFIPAAGYRSNKEIICNGDLCSYWTRSYNCYFVSDDAISFSGSNSLGAIEHRRVDGLTVRPVLNKSKQLIADQKIYIDSLIRVDTTTIAIDNIHLNTTRADFEREKKTFLVNNKKIGDYSIKSVVGLFYKNRLAAVEIISEAQNAYKGSIALNNWGNMYDEKYKKISNTNDNKFHYIYKNKGIIVTDYCASDKPYSSFQNFMEQPLKRGYRNEPTFPAHRMENNSDGIFQVSRVLGALPENRKKYYNNIISDAASRRNPNDVFSSLTSTYQSVYDQARVEANRIIEQRNDINSKKHKNDPSWSVIIIAYMPTVIDYRIEQQEKAKEQEVEQKNERQKELDKL